MTKVGHIAVNTFRETVRDKVLYNLVLFAILIIGSSYVLSKISVYQEIRIIKDLGLAAVSIFGIVIAIFIGIQLVSKEIERRTLYSLLPKPISRAEFILGKYFGLCLTLVVNVVAMTVGLFVLLAAMGQDLQPALVSAIFLIYVKLTVLTAVALFFSTFTSPTLAGLFSLFIYVGGYFSADLRNFDSVVDSAVLPKITLVLYYLLPNFKNFDVKAIAVSGESIPMAQLLMATGYGGLYIAALLLASVLVFQKRNLK